MSTQKVDRLSGLKRLSTVLALLAVLTACRLPAVAPTTAPEVLPTPTAPRQTEGSKPAPPPAIRGAWVQARSIVTPDGADQVIAQAQVGGLNALFVNVLAYGYAYYRSALLETHPEVAPDYDPLAYVAEQAHRRGIAVHTWLVAGPMSYRGQPSPALARHPAWSMTGPDGGKTAWLNYTRPDVRQFIVDFVVEIARNYDIDGVHFDYTRYPGSQWGFDPYSAALFAQEYGIDLDPLRYSELPAYAFFSGNPLGQSSTAQVLATFKGGYPAVTLNKYGEGEAILLNWSAEERVVGAGSEILNRGIRYLMDAGGAVYILRSESTAARYGLGPFEKGVAWLEDLGWPPIKVGEADVADLGKDSVLVMPNVYLIEDEVASALASFVHRGGGIVFIDGPTPSMGNKALQDITGMRSRGRHFGQLQSLIATQEHEIIPVSDRPLNLEEHRALDAQWKAFRRKGIDQLLQEVYVRANEEAPDILVTITVSSDQDELAEQHLLDWQAWLEGEYIDLIIPRAYVDPYESLAPVIADWRSAIERTDRIAFGLKVYSGDADDSVPKTPERILSEISIVCASGSEGFLLFDMEHTSRDMLAALSVGPLSSHGIVPSPVKELAR